MSELADAVLSMIRTRADVWRWGVANAHGRQMHDAIDILEMEFATGDPAEVWSVTNKALASAVKVIARADDSSGIIGDACRRLLDLHPVAAAAARVTPGELIDWMIKFQFDGDVDYFQLDPVQYAPALGDKGVSEYRRRLHEIERRFGPRPVERWQGPNSHGWYVLDWNAQRLAVLDHDIDAIIATHARDKKVAAWFEDTAQAFEEIGEIDLAIDWAEQATEFDNGHQSRKASDYWCRLLEQHRPEDALAARLVVFRRWPSSSSAARLHQAAGSAWPDHRPEVLTTLASSPRDAVLFALLTLHEPELAWTLAHELHLDSDDTWSQLVKTYEKLDAAAVIPVHRRLVENELTNADAKSYQRAARRLAKMRKLAAGTAQAQDVEELISELRETYRRRPRLQQEFDRAGLP